MHISNPYTEMREGETGFPTEMAQQSRDYLRRQVEARARLRGAGVDISIGLCWQESACDVWKQYDEADRCMYREKQVYYQQAGKERRRNR